MPDPKTPVAEWVAVMGVNVSDKKCLIETITAAKPCSSAQTYKKFAAALDFSSSPNFSNLRSSDFVPIEKAALLSGRRVVFVSLPGFEADRSEWEVVQDITNWLSWTDQRKLKLAGIVYLHPINDDGLSISAQRFFRLFERMVGKNAFSRVILATSTWNPIDEATDEIMHKVLKETWWADILGRGSRATSFKGDQATGTDILEMIIIDRNTNKAIKAGKTTKLAIRQEMVDHECELEKTDIWSYFNRDVQTTTEKRCQRLLGALLVEYWSVAERLDKELAVKLRSRLTRLRFILRSIKDNLDPSFTQLTLDEVYVTSVQVDSDGPVYTELQQGQIRLVRLRAGEGATLVEISLEVRNLEDQPEYEALSYVVGKVDSDGLLNVRSGDQVEKHSVSQALEEVLKILRWSGKDRRLWVDALSIDQKNLKERSEQVRLMSQIFRAAKNVCIWLGPEKDKSSVAINFIPDVVNLEVLDSHVQAKDEKDESVKKVEWIALARLLGRDWFRRRWVVQEMALAKEATVYCGTEDPVPWADLVYAAELFGSRWLNIKRILRDDDYELGEVHAPGAASLVNISSNIFRKGRDGDIQERRFSIETLLAILPMFEVTDALDSFYAIMDLANDIYNTNEVPVDYKKKPADLFQAVLQVAIKNSNSLDIICRPWAPTCPSKSIFPSWIRTVDDYAYVRRQDGQYDRQNADSLVGLPGQKLYRAAGVFAPQYKLDKSVLAAKGIQIGTIRATGSRGINGNIPQSWMRLGGWSKNTQTAPQSFWRTLVADRGPDGSNPPSWYGKAVDHSFKQSPTLDVNTSKLIKNPNTPTSVREFLRRLQTTTWNRRFFEMKPIKEGPLLDCIGLGPPQTRADDIVCVLYGCSVPVLLRWKKNNKGVREKNENGDPKYYELIGECFVYGMMEGQAITGLQSGRYTETDFEIK